MSEYEILFVDDDEMILDMVGKYLKKEGYAVSLINSGFKALDLLQKKNFDIVFTDFKMPGIDGIDLLSAIKDYRPDTEVIIVTGHGTMENAVKAMKIGSYDFLQKPFKLDLLKLVINRIIEEKQLKDQDVILRKRIKERHRYDALVGISLRMQEIFEIIDRMKTASPNVLIQGESGTGKQLIAGTVHRHSDRSDIPLVPVRCGNFFKDQPEEEIRRRLTDLIQGASGGTLLLEDFTCVPPEAQALFLQLLKGMDGVADKKQLPTEAGIRVIATTDQDLKDAVERDRLDRDFLKFINRVSIRIPPLRKRKEDICLLIHHFIEKFNQAGARKIYGLSFEALSYLLSYHWPGNVIQLENVVERAFAMGAQNKIDVADLPPEITTYGDLSRQG